MTRVGRILTWYALVGLPLLMLAAVPAVAAVINSNQTLVVVQNAHGFFLAWAMFGAWGLAVYHWGSRYPADDPSKRRWGLVVVFGAFIGSWVYWLAGSKKVPAEPIRLAGT